MAKIGKPENVLTVVPVDRENELVSEMIRFQTDYTVEHLPPDDNDNPKYHRIIADLDRVGPETDPTFFKRLMNVTKTCLICLRMEQVSREARFRSLRAKLEKTDAVREECRKEANERVEALKAHHKAELARVEEQWVKTEHDLVRVLQEREDECRRLKQDTKDRRSKALKIAQDRVQALEAQLDAWQAEPLISRILRAWRGI